MAAKIMVPAAPFAKLQIKEPSLDASGPSTASVEPASRVAHLEHSVRFLQEQHRLMLNGLHSEIETLRERNRDLVFQLIFNKESSNTSALCEGATGNTEETRLKLEVSRLEEEVAAAKYKAHEVTQALAQTKFILDTEIAKRYEIEALQCKRCSEDCNVVYASKDDGRAELRSKLGEANRLVRKLRADAERQRREVQAASGAVTNLLFDDAGPRGAHVESMQSYLHQSATIDIGFHNSYQFPPLPTHDFYRTPEVCGRTPRAGRQLTLPDLGDGATIFVNNHARPRGYFGEKTNRVQSNAENISPRSPEVSSYQSIVKQLIPPIEKPVTDDLLKYPELKIVVTKILPQLQTNASNVSWGNRARPRHPRPRPTRTPPQH